MPEPLSTLFRDAADTLDRMKADARHLRELGQRAKVVAKVASVQAKIKIEATLERLAQGMAEMERAAQRARGRGR
jgi:transaldolase